MFSFKIPNKKDLFQYDSDIVLVFDREYAGEEVHFSTDGRKAYPRIIDENPYTMQYTGGDQSHNNLHPVEVVAFWRRIK